MRSVLLTAAAALALTACGNSNPNTGADAAGTTQTETGMTGPNPDGTAAPTVGQSQPTNAAEDAVAGAVGQVSAAATSSPEGFVTAAAIGDMYEIESSKLALQKSQNADVKKFAQQMITDHTRTSGELKKIASSANLTPPTQLDNRRQGMIDNLKAATGAAFDKAYITQQQASHAETVTLLENQINDGQNAALKQFAQKNLPAVRMHREMVDKMGS
jgi:putative membrane protein